MTDRATSVASLFKALDSERVRVTVDEDLESRSLNVYWGDGPGPSAKLSRRLRDADQGKVIGYCRMTGRVDRRPTAKRRVA
jgi:hypothetical protein